MKIICLSVAAIGCVASAGAANQTACEALAKPRLFPSTTISSAREIPRDRAAGVTPHCEVTGYLAPVAGSRIGVVYRLPDAWNEKLLGLGGIGWAGDLRLDAAAPMLASGYATAQSDGGHASTDLWDTSWSANPQAVTDFSWRAVHLMTQLGKDLVARYYGRPQTRAYFHGCSTGGRQGLMEAQRFPADYDGIVAGAPVNTLLTQTSALTRALAFHAPGAALAPENLARLNEATLAACDTEDGLADGIVTDPRACTIDPAVIACQADAPSPGCLRPAQIEAVRSVYQAVKTADGQIASYPLLPGDEAGWPRFVDVDASSPLGTGPQTAGIGDLRALMFRNRNFDLATFDAGRDFALVRGSPFAATYEAASPDLAAFVERGGKLILWHGLDDPGPSPLATIEYFEAVQQALGARARTLNAPVRLFLAPGVEHCRGGRGANEFDALRALAGWIERKDSPESIPATRADRTLSRPLCRYPALPRYQGTGDPNDAASFDCR